jgi:hypothetical protein
MEVTDVERCRNLSGIPIIGRPVHVGLQVVRGDGDAFRVRIRACRRGRVVMRTVSGASLSRRWIWSVRVAAT